jgi:ribose-phosphate pyrophosphokinase
MEENEVVIPKPGTIRRPSFSATSAHTKPKSLQRPNEITIDSLKLISGSANPKLSESVAKVLKVPVCAATISRFADGEVCVQINENVRGKDVFIIQTCAAPVNDSIMELLLTVSSCRRASARRIVAVIPYFGYKHHRRGNSISSKHNSRFLISSAADFATMLQELGVDRIISVDLQRPGQGLEACFFDNTIPVETVLMTDSFARYLLQVHELKTPVTIIAPNAEVYKKAKQFKRELEKHIKEGEIKVIPYFSVESDSGATSGEVEQLKSTEDSPVRASFLCFSQKFFSFFFFLLMFFC